jgi:hypothetical protein
MSSALIPYFRPNARLYMAAACFGIGAATEAYTGTKITKHYDYNKKLVRKETEYNGAHATGLGWGLLAAAFIMSDAAK